MLQTQAAASALDLINPQSKPGGTNKTSDSGAFSSEFEREVRSRKQAQERSSEERRGAERRKAGQDKAAENKQRAQERADNSRDSKRAEGGKDKRAEAEREEDKDGKILPHGMPLDELFADERLGDAIRKALGEELDDAEAPLALPLNWSDYRAQQAQQGGDALADEDLEDTPLLRDLLRQRQMAAMAERNMLDGEGKKAKSDFMVELTAQSAGARHVASVEPLPGSATLSQSSTPTSQANPLPAQLTLAQPMQQKGWDQAMGQRVVWMVRNNIQEAQIQLNPRELGPINVRVSIQNDQANVQFVAHHATTREALESALPRLREMLSESGLNLAQSDVSQHNPGRQGGEAGEGGQRQGSSADPSASDEHDDLAAQEGRHVGQLGPPGVDYFV